MSVVHRESSRKMTPKNKLLLLVVIIGWIEAVSGGTFSNVVVQRADIIPVEYFNYNPSSLAFENPQLAQLTAAPLESIIPPVSTLVSSCVAPCVIPNVSGGNLAPISSTSNAKIVAYKTTVPNGPVVVTGKEAARGYQYAYAVYDDHTGDKKSQIEQSDGSAVQGQYSFIQPDGFRREVVYTADDLKGFNAVVRNIPPEQEQPKEKKSDIVKSDIVKSSAPCPNAHNEHLTHHSTEENSSEEGHIAGEHLEGKHHQKSEESSIQISEELSAEKEPEGHTENEEEPHHPVVPNVPVTTNVISYNDIIKCLQSKLRGANSVISPLTYIIIPSSKGPC